AILVESESQMKTRALLGVCEQNQILSWPQRGPDWKDELEFIKWIIGQGHPAQIHGARSIIIQLDQIRVFAAHERRGIVPRQHLVDPEVSEARIYDPRPRKRRRRLPAGGRILTDDCDGLRPVDQSREDDRIRKRGFGSKRAAIERIAVMSQPRPA